MTGLPTQTEPQVVRRETGTTVRKRVEIRGIVQGVGFRPFVHNLARGFQISGYISNTSQGVLIEVEGHQSALESFLDKLIHNPPPLAQIEEVVVSDIERLGEVTFTIRESVEQAGQFVLVSPDVATCDDCWRDFTNPANRRFGYPFTNCTNCGPRYTIIQNIPYDRPKTTMASFQMCPACQAEYDDPGDRRFHAQPNACPKCGPSLVLSRADSILPVGQLPFGFSDLSLSIIRDTRRLLREGKIVAIKGLGGFHLACDAENDEAVGLLRSRKRRSDKPFALMARDFATVEKFCFVSKADQRALASPQRPIVILARRPGTKISAKVAPGNNTLGVMLPYTPLHYLLFADSPDEPPAFTALVMTSGNMSEEPIVTRNEDVGIRLHSVPDWFLLHNRDIYMRVDDSVVRTFQGKEQLLRRSRGYAPYPIDLGVKVQEILACGAELKNTFCLTKDHYAFLSQHIGDLENYETLIFFQETLTNLRKLFRVTPRIVAYDLHPLYLSTRLALEFDGMEKIGVQHHHAHIASCMADNRLREKVIGVAFDGTGYGTDGQIWGGEFLVADFAGFERRAHFRYVPLPGGDIAIRQPWRAALSYLRETFGAHSSNLNLPLDGKIPPNKLALVQAMLARSVNTVQTSSCGRLFDAVSSILGIRQEINFEGQAAIELEMAAVKGVGGAYPFDIIPTDPWQVDMRPTIEEIVQELRQDKEKGFISAKFHNTVAAVIVEVCRRLRQQEGLNRVCLTGGTFQNMYLLERTVARLRGCGFEVFLHEKTPPNDGGIALGQAAIANEIARKGGQSVPGYSRQDS